MHRDGPLWRVVRASMSLVGIAPPLPHQDVELVAKALKARLEVVKFIENGIGIGKKSVEFGFKLSRVSRLPS